MRPRHQACVFSLLLALSHVTSFSISQRSGGRATDLADALALLQRQRRQADAPDFLGPGRLMGGRSFTLDDVSDWLSQAEEGRDEMDDSDWMSDKGNFRDFDDEEDFSQYDIPPLVAPPSRPRPPVAESVSRAELDDIFDKDSENRADHVRTALKKRKEENMMNVKEEKKMEKKKSAGSAQALSLDTLTKEEFNALMKAVEKLQRQAAKLSEEETSSSDVIVEPVDVKETLVESLPVDDDMPAGEPVGKAELESVFDDGDGPVVEKTKIIEEAVPGPDGETLIERKVETDTEPEDEDTEEALEDAVASEIERGISETTKAAENMVEDLDELDPRDEDAEDDAENFWLLNKYMGKGLAPQKRTAKRAVILPDQLMDEASDALQAAIEEEAGRQEEEAEEAEEDEEDEDSNRGALAVLPKVPSVDMFLRKILQLQDEVDHLRMVARLEDLENDVLTDALNEATLGQREGTVSQLEFSSLQQAIQLEEALQDLKESNSKGERDGVRPASGDVMKRGEPWKRRQEVTRHTGSRGSQLTAPDVERLLEQTYRQVQDDGETRDDTQIASLFLRDADTCPAVRSYNNNCELADMYSLPVDYEARALCNLHQMCYQCGHSLHVSQSHCDTVYREAATALCEARDACVVESEIFLRTMKLKTRYVPHAQPLCRSSCAAKFLGLL